MYSEERGKKVDMKVEKTRTEVREGIIGLSLLKLLFIVISPTELSDNMFDLSVKNSI